MHLHLLEAYAKLTCLTYTPPYGTMLPLWLFALAVHNTMAFPLLLSDSSSIGAKPLSEYATSLPPPAMEPAQPLERRSTREDFIRQCTKCMGVCLRVFSFSCSIVGAGF